MRSMQDLLDQHQAEWDAVDWSRPPEWTPLWRARAIVLPQLRMFSDPFDAVLMIFLIRQSIEEVMEGAAEFPRARVGG